MKKLLVITLCIITLVFQRVREIMRNLKQNYQNKKEVSKVKLTELTDFNGTMLILFRHM